jgi:hypothetical protein
LPVVDEPPDIPAAATTWQQRYDIIVLDDQRTVWVAANPPLHYLLVAPLVALARVTDRADGGLLYLRLANVGFAAVGVALTYLLARQVTGSHRIAISAMTMVALLPQGREQFALAMNDGLGFAVTTGLAWAAVRCARRRPSPGDLALLGLSAAAAWGARTVTFGVAVAVVALVAWFQLRTREAWSARWRSAGRVVLAGLVPAAVLFGWFYVRNVVLYGDLAAASYIADHQGLAGRSRGAVLSGDLWRGVYHGLVGTLLSDFVGPTSTIVRVLADVVAAVALAGLALLVLRRRGASETAEEATPGRVAPDGRALLLMATVVVVTSLGLAAFYLEGGPPYSRYEFPALAAMATLVAVGLDRVAPRAGTVIVVALLAVRSWQVSRSWEQVIDTFTLDDTVPANLRRAVGSTASTNACLALAVLGSVLVGVSLAWRRSAEGSEQGRSSLRPP